jgi:hypothetical protein
VEARVETSTRAAQQAVAVATVAVAEAHAVAGGAAATAASKAVPLAQHPKYSGNVEWETTVRPQATNAAKSKGRGHFRSAPTTATSRRQQAHTRKRVPTALPPHLLS